MNDDIDSIIGMISTGLANGDYCNGCWKFHFCRYPWHIFKPCQAFSLLTDDISKLIRLANEVLDD